MVKFNKKEKPLRGYRIKVESSTGETTTYNKVSNYRHESEGLILEFEDKPTMTIEKGLIHRLWVGPVSESGESDLQQINS